jgi:hypothetical protein
MPTDLAFRLAPKQAIFVFLEQSRGEGWWGKEGMADYYAQQAGGADPFSWVRVHPLLTPEAMREYPFDHAGQGETSLMLALCPEGVDMGHLAEGAWYTRSARDASRELGERGRELILAHLRRAVGGRSFRTARGCGPEQGESRPYFFGNDETRPLQVVEDLKLYLPTKQKRHYRPGYSLVETARSWLAAKPRLPPRIAEIVGDLELTRVHFEYGMPVLGGGISQTDVMAFAADDVIAVEGKCREPFGEIVSGWIERQAQDNPRSAENRRRAIHRYGEALGTTFEHLCTVHYQLLHRTLSAALVARASAAARAWMIVQSFAPRGSR